MVKRETPTNPDSSTSTRSSSKKPKLELKIESESKPEVNIESQFEAGSSSNPAPDSGRRKGIQEIHSRFLGDPVPDDVARSRWPHRYPDETVSVNPIRKPPVAKGPDDDPDPVLAKRHYSKAEVDDIHIFELNDDAHVVSPGNDPPHICKIVEFFEGLDGQPYFRAKWYYRPNDTVIKDAFPFRETKRIFQSEVYDDNPLDCLLHRITIVRVPPNLDLAAKEEMIPKCDYYYDMKYLLPYSTFVEPTEAIVGASDSQSTVSSTDVDDPKTANTQMVQGESSSSSEMTLLDLYSGCGAMSTGLCLGATIGGVNLVTKWAVDLNEHACESLKLNHPETEVRNETVEDFLMLLIEWKKLCASYRLIISDDTHNVVDAMEADDSDDAEEDEPDKGTFTTGKVFEVERIIGICYGTPKAKSTAGLHFKVSWKGYGPAEDSWEPVDGLGNCYNAIGEFVRKGYQERVLPIPGDVDVICGGPPCQGLSGFNRFRNKEKPLEDPKNSQLLVYMDVIEYLKPKYLLMENVVDLVKFAKGFCGRYAIGRLVDMNYQARLGMMAAGAYGLPQFRMRVFLFGARPSESLPQYPLPTHDLVLRGVIPLEFERNTVAYEEGHRVQLEDKLLLGDAISDLPPVNNDESRDEMPYSKEPEKEFQRFIRLSKAAMEGSGTELISKLYDHRPLQLSVDDYQRVCRVPKAKGANFRDLPGVLVRHDNKVEFDRNVERVLLPSGKPLVPSYAMSFVGGTSSKPFGRLWYDETVPTVVTRAEPHNQCICHPYQDRVLTIRENARLQGFPDYYQLKGPIKQRYMQVGNAVAVPVARALGYALALASQGSVDDKPLLTLPTGFPVINRAVVDSEQSEDQN